MLIYQLYKKSHNKIYNPDLIKKMTINELNDELKVTEKLLEEIQLKNSKESKVFKEVYEKSITIINYEIEKRVPR